MVEEPALLALLLLLVLVLGLLGLGGARNVAEEVGAGAGGGVRQHRAVLDRGEDLVQLFLVAAEIVIVTSSAALRVAEARQN